MPGDVEKITFLWQRQTIPCRYRNLKPQWMYQVSSIRLFAKRQTSSLSVCWWVKWQRLWRTAFRRERTTKRGIFKMNTQFFNDHTLFYLCLYFYREFFSSHWKQGWKRFWARQNIGKCVNTSSLDLGILTSYRMFTMARLGNHLWANAHTPTGVWVCWHVAMDGQFLKQTLFHWLCRYRLLHESSRSTYYCIGCSIKASSKTQFEMIS